MAPTLWRVMKALFTGQSPATAYRPLNPAVFVQQAAVACWGSRQRCEHTATAGRGGRWQRRGENVALYFLSSPHPLIMIVQWRETGMSTSRQGGVNEELKTRFEA